MLSQSLIYSGRTESNGPSTICLKCGLLAFSFDPQWAWIRTIRVDGREAIRAIYAAVRDRYWNTVRPQLSNLRVLTTEKTVEIDFDALCQEGEIDFAWKGRVRCTADGTLSYALDGVAQTTFLKNRIGFCVLHPSECAGRTCTVEKVDGSIASDRFPDHISPHQSFLNLRALSYEVVPGLIAETRFEGDIFETEDQRNWTDASYKTYCTPLSRPYPVTINAGEEVRQMVTLRLTGQFPGNGRLRQLGSIQSIVAPGGGEAVPLPQLGLCLSSDVFVQSDAALARLKQLHLCHVRLDLNLDQSGWESRLADGVIQAEKLGTPIELAIQVSDDAETQLSLLTSRLAMSAPSLSVCLVFRRGERTTPPELLVLARRLLAPALTGVPIGGGSNVYFTELNRNRLLANADVACYPITPQVHAFDDDSLLETPPVQGSTVRTARSFLGPVPVLVTPVTLKPRRNPNAGEDVREASGRLPASVDVRQVSLIGAVWTLASIKHLAEGGAASVTYYETVGWKGVMEPNQCDPAPFPSLPGSVYPLYHVLADVGEFREAMVVPTVSSTRPGVEALLLLKEDRRRLILANATRSLQSVSVRQCGFDGFVRAKVLDETNAEEARCRPETYRQTAGLLREVRDDRLTVSLLPYAVMTIDSSFASYRSATGASSAERARP